MSTNYSNSKCPKCESTNFEVVEDTPENSNWKMFFLRCSSCKTLISTHEYMNIGYMVNKMLSHFRIS